MAEIDSGLAALSIQDRVENAVKGFEKKQQGSNMKWLEAQVLDYEDAKEKDKQNSRDELAHIFEANSWNALATQHGIAEPRDLLSLEADIGQRDTGTRPPVPEQERKIFLQKLRDRINFVYDQDDPNFAPMSLPEDYVSLMSIIDGIRDNDLRKAGVAGLNGIRGNTANRITRNYVERLPLGTLDNWEMSTGCILGKGHPEHVNTLMYFYCRRLGKDDVEQRLNIEVPDSQREWRWRIFYQEPEKFQLGFEHSLELVIFDDIVEWLEVYQDWWHRESVVYPAWRQRLDCEFRMVYNIGVEEDEDVPEQEGSGCACGEDVCGEECEARLRTEQGMHLD